MGIQGVPPVRGRSRGSWGWGSDTTAGVVISRAIQVQVLDLFNNRLTGDNSDQVTLAVAPSEHGPEMSCGILANAPE